MFLSPSSARFLKLSSLAMLLSGAALAAPGTTVRITNTSKQPWILRILEEGADAVIASGSRDSRPVELGAQSQKFAFPIEPGETTCILQFKEKREQSVKQKVGLVDRHGEEKGHVELQSRALPAEGEASLRSLDPGERVSVELFPDEEASRILKLESAEACDIVADTWN